MRIVEDRSKAICEMKEFKEEDVELTINTSFSRIYDAIFHGDPSEKSDADIKITMKKAVGTIFQWSCSLGLMK